jgi:hypothetical protein
VAETEPPLVIPEPEVRARPATQAEIPRAAKKFARRQGVTVSYARGYAEVSRLIDAPERGEGKRKRSISVALIESIVIRAERWVAVWENGRTAGAFAWTPEGGWKTVALAEIGQGQQNGPGRPVEGVFPGGPFDLMP